MTPYKGIVRIVCLDKACKYSLLQPAAGCIHCERARLEILDLEGKILAERKNVALKNIHSSQAKKFDIKPGTYSE